MGRIRARIAAAESELADAVKAADREFDVWSDKLPEGPHELHPDGATGFFDFDALDKDAVPNRVTGGSPAMVHGSPAVISGRHGNALRLNRGSTVVFSEDGRFTRSDAFSFSLWVKVPSVDGRMTLFHHSATLANAARRGYEVSIENGRLAFALYHNQLVDLAKVISRNALVPDTWSHLAVTYDGSSRAAGMKVFLNGERTTLEVTEDALRNDIELEIGEAKLTIGSIAGDSGFDGVVIDEFRVFGRALSSIEIASLAGRNDFTAALQAIPHLSPAQRAELLECYIATTHQASIDARASLTAARNAERTAVNARLRAKR